MCGIAGIITKDGRAPDRAALTAMRDALAHRGPDGADIFIGNGVSELVVMAMQGLLNDGDEVLVYADLKPTRADQATPGEFSSMTVNLTAQDATHSTKVGLVEVERRFDDGERARERVRRHAGSPTRAYATRAAAASPDQSVGSTRLMIRRSPSSSPRTW